MIKINQLDTSVIDVKKYYNDLSNVFDNQKNVTLGGVFNEEIIQTQNLIGDYYNSNAILCSSGTTALLGSIEYAILKAQNKKITWVVSEYIYFSIYSYILSRKEKVIFLKANEDEVTLNPVDLSKEEYCILLLTNHNNMFTNLNDVLRTVDLNNSFVIEDCCLVFDNTLMRTSNVQCYSFSNNKLIVAGEGGCVVSKDKSFIDWFRWRTFSGIKPTVTSPFFMYRGKFNVEKHPYPYKCSINVMTSLLIKIQLKNIDEILNKRRKNYDYLYNELCLTDYQFKLPHAPLFYPLILPKKLPFRELERFQLLLLKKDIQTTIGVLPHYSYNNNNLLSKHIINIPVHGMLTEDGLKKIATVVKESL